MNDILETDKKPVNIFNEDFIFSEMKLEKLYQLNRPSILFVKNGNAKLSIQIKQIDLVANSIVLFEKDSTLKIHSLSDDFEIRVLTYTNDFIEKLGLKLNKLKVFKHFRTHINMIAHVSDAELKLFWIQLELMTTMLDKNISLNYNDDIIEHLFSAFIYSVSGSLLSQEILEKNTMTRQEEITFEFVKNVFENFKREKSLQFYADEQNLTIRHLSSVVKSVTQKSANQIISEFVMNEAKILLNTKNTAVQDIAEKLQFSDPYSFSHFFKKHEGISPKQFQTQSS